jgi:hypothetical protein
MLMIDHIFQLFYTEKRRRRKKCLKKSEAWANRKHELNSSETRCN